MGYEEIRLFQRLLEEAKIHRERIEEARKCLAEDPDNIPCSDQMIYRFSKLQDTMGRKLFRALLHAVGDWESTMTMIDILNRMDKLRLIEPDKWREIRDIRNEIAHNYDDDPEVTKNILSNIEKALPILDHFMTGIEKFATQKGLL